MITETALRSKKGTIPVHALKHHVLRAIASRAWCANVITAVSSFLAGDISPSRLTPMVDFMIGLAFVAMIVTPALVATFQRTNSRDNDL